MITTQNNHCECHNRCRAEGWKKEADAWMCKYADLKKKYMIVKELIKGLHDAVDHIHSEDTGKIEMEWSIYREEDGE